MSLSSQLASHGLVLSDDLTYAKCCERWDKLGTSVVLEDFAGLPKDKCGVFLDEHVDTQDQEEAMNLWEALGSFLQGDAYSRYYGRLGRRSPGARDWSSFEQKIQMMSLQSRWNPRDHHSFPARDQRGVLAMLSLCRFRLGTNDHMYPDCIINKLPFEIVFEILAAAYYGSGASVVTKTNEMCSVCGLFVDFQNLTCHFHKAHQRIERVKNDTPFPVLPPSEDDPTWFTLWQEFMVAYMLKACSLDRHLSFDESIVYVWGSRSGALWTTNMKGLKPSSSMKLSKTQGSVTVDGTRYMVIRREGSLVFAQKGPQRCLLLEASRVNVVIISQSVQHTSGNHHDDFLLKFEEMLKCQKF